MTRSLELHPDRLFPADEATRRIARELYKTVEWLPIISPHGHTDPQWFASDAPFVDAAQLLITPDHYVLRMLYSLGLSLEQLGVAPLDGDPVLPHKREVWRLFARHYEMFRGTPSRLWLDWVFAEVFGLRVRLDSETSDLYFDAISAKLAEPAFRPRALFDRFRIEVLATTESPLDDLRHHRVLKASDWRGRVITAFRPDPVLDPEYPGFRANLDELSQLTGRDCTSYRDYLEALRQRRAYFATHGATSTDHGHPTAVTADLSDANAAALFQRIIRADVSAGDAELFRAHMLTVMAGMSLEDGLVMQLHPGAWRSHNPTVLARFGRDKGADIPKRTDYVGALKPLLDRYGNNRALTLIIFTLDESTCARELAPLAGHYPALRLGPAWWFHDSPEGMRRFRRQTTETAGFYNTVGFNDDTRAFCSIPARHDVARRIDCGYLAELVIEHQLSEEEAVDLASELAYKLAKQAYRL
jgi:glucuronate isomerase